MKKSSEFSKDDHRNFNRHGEQFDRGETFSGVDYELGLSVVEQLRPLVPKNDPTRWSKTHWRRISRPFPKPKWSRCRRYMRPR
jgi:hypothetical protein